MVRNKKKETDPVSEVVKSISYGTGLICAKVKNFGKVTKTKEWKEAISKTHDLVKNAGDTVNNSITEFKESFDEGVKSIVEEEEAGQEVEVKEGAVAPEEKVESSEVKEAEVVPLPNELEPADIEDIDEDLMDEEEVPKKKVVSSKPKKKEVKSVIIYQAPLANFSEFSYEEFKKEGKEPQDLIDAIHKNKPEIYIEAPGPVEWLNILLSQGVSGLPLQYEIQETPEIKQAKEAFEGAPEPEKKQQMMKLNRLILEQAYPFKCPKVQIVEPQEEVLEPKADKVKSRRPKNTDSGLNMN